MLSENIIEILSSWNFWTKTIDCGIERKELLQRLIQLAKTKQVIVITGVRRAGKSTLMKQYIHYLISKGTDARNCLYVNFEEPRFFDQLHLPFLQSLYEAYLEHIKPSQEKPYIFLDEIQLIPGWEKFVRALHEKNEAHIIVSGSSAKLLSKEFATTLTGRHVDLKVFPLLFKEFLEFKRLKITSTLDTLANKTKIKQYLREYLEYGSFPLITLQEGKKSILTSYFEDILSKDIAQRYNIKKIEKLKSIAKIYLSNVSTLTSFRKTHRILGISLDSVERYSHYLQEAYVIFFVNKFAHSIREQEINPKKIYCIDNGLKNTLSFRFSENIGQLYENTVYLHLLQQEKEVYYWKGKWECDFLIKENEKIVAAIQVSYALTRKEEEIRGLVEALHTFNLHKGIIITGEEETKEIWDGKTIECIPLWKWLLLPHKSEKKN